MCWSRLVLWAVIDQAHRNYGPVRVQTWVDDMAQRTHHPSAVTAVKASTDCATFLVQELRSRGINISGKTTVLSHPLRSTTCGRRQVCA